MKPMLEPNKRPELIFGLVAPIGVDLNIVSDTLIELLEKMRYTNSNIKITDHMSEFEIDHTLESSQYIEKYRNKIAYANKIREQHGNETLAALAISAIREERSRLRLTETSNQTDVSAGDVGAAKKEVPLNSHAFVVRQFKLPEEIRLMRRVYGRQFIQISAYSPKFLRTKNISERERDTCGGLVSEDDLKSDAQNLVSQDDKELFSSFGQNLRDCFPLGDVFIDASSKRTCEKTLARFVDLLFGSNRISPTFEEYGMYLAKSASLRSSALTRQVGAAVFSKNREVLALGSNEVPKFGGGTYWEDAENDQRDIILGRDPNDRLKIELFVDLIERLQKHELVSESALAKTNTIDAARDILIEEGPNSIKESKMMDIIEFGRDIHAEMCAITDAGRNGVSLRESVLFTTTFPCHLCAKHIVSAGIVKVIFIEPYPKSYATELNGDSICIEQDSDNKVSFTPFIGVSPYRYRELYEKGKRKYLGIAQDWHQGEKRPMLEVFIPSYFEAELKIVESLRSMLKE